MNRSYRQPARPSTSLICLVLSTVVCFAAFPVRSVGDDGTEFFEKKIRPLLVTKCGECHSGKTPEGDLRLDNSEGVSRGGMNGPAVVSGDAGHSLLLTRVLTTDEGLQMPPEERLTDSEIADLSRWINEGAAWPATGEEQGDSSAASAHWAFQPLNVQDPPITTAADWCRSEIDLFIAAKQAEVGVSPVAPADRRTLIRRATLDLTGLPPTVEEVDAFLADDQPGAFARVVDRLLASPAYGERWGRHWLDQARYADTSGDGTDTPIPEARYYRNYVIEAFNSDLPYNEFLIEQIAGDQLAELAPEHPRANDRIIATGFIALSRRFGNSAFASMELIIDDTVDTIGKSVMGLTLGCARCHHHKFDPITLNDYYGIAGYFASTQYPHAGTEHQKDREHFVAMTKTDDWPTDYDSLEAWAVSDAEKQIGDAPILVGGDPGQKGEIARRGFLSVLTEEFPEIPPDSSGRLQFAEWLVSDSNPLTPRVMVNRVWQYHFGRGIVATSSNFGLQGAKPSHPELLDWLAADFVRGGWSIKRLHRQIMLSGVYQLSSAESDASLKADEANLTLWRNSRRRMDAETIRDSLLAVSGQLKSGDSGRHPFKPTAELKYSQGRPFNQIFDHEYRTVYLMSPRLIKHPFMALFDGPDPNKTTDNRRESTVALQALYLMNSPFMRQTAEAFADRLMAFASDDEVRIDQAYQVALSRHATPDETADAVQFVSEITSSLAEQGRSETEAEHTAWMVFGRALLSSNEFLFID